MKTIFRNLGLGFLMAGCVVVTGSRAFAQDAAAGDVCKEVEAKQALYKTFTDNIPKNATLEQTETAIKAGDEYVKKYGACADDKQIVDYLNQYLPGMKKGVENSKKAEIERQKAAQNKVILDRFNTAVKGTNNVANASETYAVGKDVVGLNNEYLLDVLLVLGTVGFDQASAKTPVDTYNEETINYAKQAIEKLKANAPSGTQNYGVFGYAYKNKENADGRSNALNWMNYNIGWIMYYRQGKDNPAKRKEALPYLYESTKYTSLNQKNPTPYQAIGAWYLDEAIRIDKERQAKLAANGNKDNEETLAMVAEQKGYADRAIDAYARAHKLAKAAPKPDKAYIDNLYTRLTELYKFRYDKAEGMNEVLAKVDTTPFPDPTTPITPVIETTEPTTAPATTGTTAPATTPATGTGTTTTRPAATTPKPATAPTTGATKPAGTASTEPATNDAKTAVKKPAPKKKGTR